jgi:hypothetical protein
MRADPSASTPYDDFLFELEEKLKLQVAQKREVSSVKTKNATPIRSTQKNSSGKEATLVDSNKQNDNRKIDVSQQRNESGQSEIAIDNNGK